MLGSLDPLYPNNVNKMKFHSLSSLFIVLHEEIDKVPKVQIPYCSTQHVHSFLLFIVWFQKKSCFILCCTMEMMFDFNLGHAQSKAHFKLGVRPIMGNLSISWLIVWPQVINKILFVLGGGPMCSCVKPLKPKSRDQRL